MKSEELIRRMNKERDMTTKQKKINLPKPIPCPFCGNENGFKHKYSPIQKVYWVECPECNVQGPPHIDDYESIDVWSIRLYNPPEDNNQYDWNNYSDQE